MAAIKDKVDLDQKTNVSCGVNVRRVYSWSGSRGIIVGGNV